MTPAMEEHRAEVLAAMRRAGFDEPDQERIADAAVVELKEKIRELVDGTGEVEPRGILSQEVLEGLRHADE